MSIFFKFIIVLFIINIMYSLFISLKFINSKIKSIKVQLNEENERVRKHEKVGYRKNSYLKYVFATCLILFMLPLTLKSPLFSSKKVDNKDDFKFDSETGKIIKYIGDDTEVIIPSEINNVVVKGFETSAFMDCDNIISVEIPDSITEIASCTFYNCKKLENIKIPSSVENISGDAFYNTKWLENKRKENPLVIVNNILIDGTYCNESEIVIPDNVKKIGVGAFEDCSNIRIVYIQSGVETIEAFAFKGCIYLTKINIPDSVEFIGNDAFYCCSSLEQFILPNSIQIIFSDTFFGCTSLRYILIKNIVTNIEDKAFGENNNFVIYGTVNSTAEEYARDHDIKFLDFNAVTSQGDDVVTYAESLIGKDIDENSDLVNDYGTPDDLGAMFVYHCARESGYGSAVPNSLNGYLGGVDFFRCAGMFHDSSEQYIPKRSDIVYFDFNADGCADHVGFVSACNYDTLVAVVQVTDNDEVGVINYSINDIRILGYGTPIYA